MISQTKGASNTLNASSFLSLTGGGGGAGNSSFGYNTSTELCQTCHGNGTSGSDGVGEVVEKIKAVALGKATKPCNYPLLIQIKM